MPPYPSEGSLIVMEHLEMVKVGGRVKEILVVEWLVAGPVFELPKVVVPTKGGQESMPRFHEK